MEKNELKNAVKEYNKVIELEKPISMKSETVEKDLYEALDVIEPEDEFSDATLKVFTELRKQFDKPKTKKPEKVETKSKDVKTTVKAGTTVEMEADNNEIKIEKKMKEEKKAGKPASEKPEVRIIKTILDRKVGKDVLTKLIETEDVFADKKTKKALLAETNFMSLKKKMLDVFDEELVKKYRAELPPISHEPKAKTETKSAPVKENPVVNGIKSATKVKQLKTIAKANDQFNWKKLKKLEDFEEIQDAMLKPFGQGKDKKVKEEPKVKMVVNPLIAEINGFEKKKKLRKWAEEHVNLSKVDIEDLDLDEMKEKLIGAIPAKIEVKGGKSKSPRTENVAAERREFIIPLIKEGDSTRPELKAMLDKRFGEDTPQSHPHSNMLSEIKNEKYYKKYNLGALVVESKSGKYKFEK